MGGILTWEGSIFLFFFFSAIDMIFLSRKIPFASMLSFVCIYLVSIYVIYGHSSRSSIHPIYLYIPHKLTPHPGIIKPEENGP